MEFKINPNIIDNKRQETLSIKVFFFYTILLLIGIIIRFYHLPRESISLEEYACIANLNLNSFLEFIGKQRETYPYGGILFPILQFIWSQIFGTNIVSLRIFSLIFWVLFYFLLFFSLKRLEHKQQLPSGITLFTCTGIVFAPSLIFLSQEARMYMAYIFFAWCSFLLFLKIITDNLKNQTLLLWLLANQALLWTHHTGIILWATEFAIALLFLWKDKEKLKIVFRYILLHLILLLPWFVWILTIPPQPKELHQYYLRPDFWDVLRFPFIFNLVNIGGICPSGVVHPWQILPPFIAQAMNYAKPSFSYILIIFAIIGFVGLCYTSFSTLLKKDRKKHLLITLILLYFIIPPILLFTLAQIGPPVFTTRYIIYIMPLHFLGLGLIASKARTSIQYVLLIIMSCVLLYQFGLTIPGPMRMDWKGVGKAIQKDATPHDLILIHDPFWTTIFNLNNSHLQLPVSDAFTEEGLANLASTYLLFLHKQRITKCNIWVVEPDVHTVGTSIFSPILLKQGLSFSTHCFFGEQKIWLYKITDKSATEECQQSINITGESITKNLFERKIKLYETFVEKHRYDHDRTEFHFIRSALELMKHKQFDSADYLIKTGWERNPNLILQCYEWFSELHENSINNSVPDINISLYNTFWEGIKCLNENDFDGATTIFEMLIKDYPNEPLFWWLLAQTYDNTNLTERADFCWQELFRLYPILPIGWHIIYKPVVITWNKQEFNRLLIRSQKLNIITDHLKLDTIS